MTESAHIPGSRQELTRVQRTLLASHLAYPDKGHQNAAFLIRFPHTMDGARLARAFAHVVARSDALRTRIMARNAHPAISATPPEDSEIVELSADDFAAWAEQRARQPLDLSRACYESVIALHPEGGASWYLNLHHLISDGPSAALVLRAVDATWHGGEVAVSAFYAADRVAAASARKDSAGQFWQARQTAPRIDRIYDNLDRAGASAEQVTVLAGDAFNRNLDTGLAGPYRLLTPGLSRSAFWIFCTALYLHRLSGETAFSVGVIVNHRDRLGATDVVGPMIEIFPVDIEICDGDSHAGLHKRISQSFFRTLKNARPGTAPAQDYDALVNVLPDSVVPDSLCGQVPQVCWLYSGALDGAVPLRIMDTPYAPLAAGQPHGQRRIDLAITDDARGDVTPDAVAGHFRRIVDRALGDPGADAAGYTLAGAAELERLGDWAGTPPLPDPPQHLSSWLQDTLRDNPRVVLIEDGQDLDGDALWQWAVNVAGQLIREDAPRRIGVRMAPSIQSLVAIYGILLSGRSYVPIEPDSPPVRIENVIRTTGLTRIIATCGEIDAQRNGAAEPLPRWAPEEEAYVFFTSGSTGEPRGVAISRAGLDNYLNVIVARLRRRAGKPVAPLFGSLSFDITVNMLFAPILAGGILHVFGGNPAEAMVRIARTPDLTWLQATPSHLELLVRLLPKDHGLRTIVSGGDAMNGRLARLLDRSNPDADILIVNYYGPTETVVGCIDHELTPADRAGTGAVPIGRPLPGAELAVMDRAGHPVPPGAIGELWIAFPHMMDAYIGWTPAASGITRRHGKRFYRSGDLVRFGADGALRFHGRADHQMKIGSIRIDPNEIEEALATHPGVRRAIARLFTAGDDTRPELVAWVLAETALCPSDAELRRHLGPRLPGFAIPRAFVEIAEVPLTSAGKVDMRKLPAPGSTDSPTQMARHREPDLEQRIRALWQDVLNRASVGADDDFFAFGGDSLAALNMILTLGKTLNRRLDERLAFRETTPARLADAIRSAGGNTALPTLAAKPVQARIYDDAHPPPLSDTERAILLHDRAMPESDAYHGGRIFRWRCRIEAQDLEAALARTVARHVPLCWSFTTPRRQLPPGRRFAFSHDDDPVGFDVLLKRVDGIRRQPYDLARGPILRCHLQRLEDGQTALALMGHHVGFDHASFNTLLRQIVRSLDSAPPAEQVLDFPATLQAEVTGCEEAARDFWRGRDIPDAAPLRPIRPGTGGAQGRYIERDLTLSADRIRHAAGAPVAARALACAGIAVSAFVDGDIADLGLVTARDDDSSNEIVGCSTNQVPIWLTLRGDDTIRDIQDRAARQVADCLPFRHFPLLQVDAERRKAGKPFTAPRFLVSVIETGQMVLSGEPVTETILSSDGAVAPVSFFLLFDGTAARIGLEYDRRLIADDVAAQIADTFLSALEATVHAPEMSLHTLRDKATIPSVAITPPGPAMPGVFDRVSQWLGRGGDRIAVANDAGTLDWDTLSDRVAKLARALERAGIEPGARVAVALPRGPLYVAAILAVMGRRAAYVPIDITYPQDRIRATLKAAETDLCIGVSGLPGAECLPVDDAGIAGQDWADLDGAELLRPLGEDCAYVIFTSGSTGTPRGVAITHAQLDHSTNARHAVYDRPPDRFGLLSSFSFDSSIVGLFWTLASGATIVLSDDDTPGDPRRLADFLASDLSHVLMVPTLYAAALDRRSRTWPGHVILAGEALTLGVVRRHFDRVPDTRLTNEYGPTEGTVWSLWHHVQPDDDAVTIGRPVPGTWAAVVDDCDRPCPAGVAGQLIIGGPLVAKDYPGDPQASARAFFGSSGGELPKGRAFRTGDLAVLTPDGFRYLGRADDQINIGGLRLEPEEIETVLAAEPGVAQAVVVAHDMRTRQQLLAAAPVSILEQAVATARGASDENRAMEAALRDLMPGGSVLIAHLEADSGLDLAELARNVAARLPASHRPADFVLHDALPRTPNGKIDRGRLARTPPRPDNAPEPPGAASTPARGGADRDVAAIRDIFRSVLKSPGMGPDDSFFEFGGYSLLALRVILEIEEKLGLSLSTTDLYDTPTARGLAARHNPQGPEAAAPAVPQSDNSVVIPINRTGTATPIFAVHNLETNGSLYRPLARHLGSDQPFFGIGHARNPNMGGDWVSDPDWHTGVAEVAAEYVGRLEEIAPQGPVILIGFCLGAVYAYEMAQQMRERGREPDCVIMVNDLHAPELDIARMSRFRAIATSRLDQLRRGNLGELTRSLAKLPRFPARAAAEVRRQVEIALLRRARSQQAPLSRRLQIRKFVEDSYREVHSYRYAPYPGRVLIVREKDRDVGYRAGPTPGWGARIPDSKVALIGKDTFQSLLVEPQVAEVVDLIRQEQARAAGASRPAAPPPAAAATRRNLERPGFRLSLELASASFLEAPRPEQRDWLLQLRMRELSDELDHLHRIAPTMTPATGSLDITDRDTLALDDAEIMEDWMVPLMRRMADAVARKGAHVLEVGYGRGVSARMVQDNGIASHTIVECNPHIIADCNRWRRQHPDRNIHLVEGLWQDVTDRFTRYDGILFHTYPLDTDELLDNLDRYSTFAEEFFPVAARHLNPGGRFTYFTNEADSLGRAHQRALLDHFDAFTMTRLDDLNIPDDSADAHWFQSLVMIEAHRA